MAKVKKRKVLRTQSGAELTPEIIDALAAEAEGGYDLSEARRRPVGRPSLSGNGSSPRMSFRTSPETYGAAQRRAEEEGISISELAREALDRYLSPAPR
ncbi:MAG: hypothetical protein WD810_08600 [Solirubrobacterales bacterium]